MISRWKELKKAVLTTKKDVLEQIVWNNRFIKIDKLSVYFRSWHQAGMDKRSSLVNENNDRFLSFNEFRKYVVNCNFLQYHGLLSEIPREQYVNLPAIDKSTCKTI